MIINAKIKELRKARKCTLERLAYLCDMTKGYLSKVERSSTPPPFTTLQKIARALEVDIKELIEEKPSGPSKNIDICKKVDREKSAPVESAGGYSFHSLLNNYKNKYMAPYILEIAQGETAEFNHDGEEFVYVLEGKITMRYEDNDYEFEPGDCFYLDSRIKHKFINKSRKKASLLSTDYAYRRF